MNYNVFFATALCLSAAAIIISFICVTVLHRREIARGKSLLKERATSITPFYVFVAGFFFAALIINFPVSYVEAFGDDQGFVRVFKSIFLTIQNTLQMFTLDASFDGMIELMSNSEVDSVLSNAYSSYAVVMLVIAPALTAGFILSFFKEASATFNYTMHFYADVYILSELNARSLALAQNLFTDTSIAGRKVVVFTDVSEQTLDDHPEMVARAKRMGAIIMRKNVLEIGLKYFSTNIHRKIYLIAEDEDDNVKDALSIIARCRNTARYNTPKTEVYVFSTSVESEILLNSIDYGNIKVRRINENRNLVLDTLRHRSIFANSITTERGKEITLVICGLGSYGTELLKAVCWMGQMPGYVLNVHVFDKDENAKEKVRCVAPELISYNNVDIEGEPYYNITFHEGIDVDSYVFQEEIAAIKNVTMAFVTLGDDELNIDTAMKLRVQFGRVEMERGTPVPAIHPVVYSMAKTQAARRGGLKNMRDQDYGIRFIGDMHSRYSIRSIEQLGLEDLGLKGHLRWVKKSEEEDATAKFNRFEYYRRSSMAQAIYLEQRTALGFIEREVDDENDKVFNEMLMLYEHRRWSAFMRSEGYVGGPKKDDMAKTHPDLIPYKDLSEAAKAKDSVR